jgi:hypothetical protein
MIIRIKDDSHTGLRAELCVDHDSCTEAELEVAAATWPRVICGFQSLSAKEQNRELRNWAGRIRRAGVDVRTEGERA